MMKPTRSEQQLLTDWRAEASDTALLFSNQGQARQERTAVAGLLQVLGVPFRYDEIVKRGPEPVDVWFGDARFQVTEILDSGRRRNLEIRQRAERARDAGRLTELLEPISLSSQPMELDEVLALVRERCKEKAQSYAGQVGGIDLLVYINLKARHFMPGGSLPTAIDPAFRAWRSVSVIMERVAIVVWAAGDAPAFLRRHHGQVVNWDRMDSVFPILGETD
jgi:Putative endonuclease, protein of unknown function (DUF1780)